MISTRDSRVDLPESFDVDWKIIYIYKQISKSYVEEYDQKI